MKNLLFVGFRLINKLFSGKGILRYKPFRTIFYRIYKYTKPKGLVLVNVNDYKMYVDSEDIGVALKLLTRGSYESYETEIFKSIVKKGMKLVDVGANIGYYTLLGAKLVGVTGKVFAFEPEQYNFDILKRNVELNSFANVVLVKRGVSDKLGRTKLFLDVETKGSHSLYRKVAEKDSIEIEMTTLDKFFENISNTIDVIKIDVEGAESNVFGGMKRILKKERLIIFTEFHPELLEKSGTTPEKYLNEIIKSGFKLYNINEMKNKLEPVGIKETVEFCKKEKRPTNLLCIKGMKLSDIQHV